MTAEDRNAWVQVARQTLRGMPADLLKRGCQEARKRCRFASEIVPTIIETVEAAWQGRERFEREQRILEANRNAPRLTQAEPEYVTAEEMRQIIREVAEERRAN